MYGSMNDSHDKMSNKRNELQKKIFKNNLFNWRLKTRETTTYYIRKHICSKSAKQIWEK